MPPHSRRRRGSHAIASVTQAHEQRLEHVRPQDLRPKLTNDRPLGVLGRLFCLQLCRFCFMTPGRIGCDRAIPTKGDSGPARIRLLARGSFAGSAIQVMLAGEHLLVTGWISTLFMRENCGKAFPVYHYLTEDITPYAR